MLESGCEQCSANNLARAPISFSGMSTQCSVTPVRLYVQTVIPSSKTAYVINVELAGIVSEAERNCGVTDRDSCLADSRERSDRREALLYHSHWASPLRGLSRSLIRTMAL